MTRGADFAEAGYSAGGDPDFGGYILQGKAGRLVAQICAVAGAYDCLCAA